MVANQGIMSLDRTLLRLKLSRLIAQAIGQDVWKVVEQLMLLP
jgi:hypothetical protein